MTPQTISEITDFIERNELHAFSVEDVQGKDKYEGFTSEKNTKDTVSRFNEVSAKLPQGTYKIKSWKVGGQANPYTRFFSIGTPNVPNSLSKNDSDLMYKIGAMETELRFQKQIDSLNLTILQLQTKRTKKPTVNPLHALIVNSLMSSTIIQTKVADLMGDEKGQAFLLKMNSLVQNEEDEDEDEEDEND